MVHSNDTSKQSRLADELFEEPRNARIKQKGGDGLPTAPDNKGEVYEESEEGVVYSPNNPGSEQQMREAKKILEKENRNEQA
ncbi:MAG TPA: hypothetical protein VFX79_00445 [Candidatus Saccharimonadales bacterium]|nr:hypothetical protein [Candidatus Saccharimonadales bacterium]